MASPHVAGIAALVKAANPTLTAAQIRALLIGTSTTQAGVGLPNNGRVVDALRAVQAAGGSASGPLLVVTPSTIDFGATSTTATVTIENLGTGNLVGSSVTGNPAPSWLSFQDFDDTPNNGLDVDRIVFTVDRTGLPNGVQQSVITLTYLDGATPVTVDLDVRVQVGASSTTTDTIFVLLVDPTTFATRYQTQTSSAQNFAFSFGSVAAGQYLLVGGTDRDNDDFLGDPGELFGAWPSLDDPRPIAVVGGANSTDLEFGMEDLVTVQSSSTSVLANGRAFRRLQ
jgi:hypothetical protein